MLRGSGTTSGIRKVFAEWRGLLLGIVIGRISGIFGLLEEAFGCSDLVFFGAETSWCPLTDTDDVRSANFTACLDVVVGGSGFCDSCVLETTLETLTSVPLCPMNFLGSLLSSRLFTLPLPCLLSIVLESVFSSTLLLLIFKSSLLIIFNFMTKSFGCDFI